MTRGSWSREVSKASCTATEPILRMETWAPAGEGTGYLRAAVCEVQNAMYDAKTGEIQHGELGFDVYQLIRERTGRKVVGMWARGNMAPSPIKVGDGLVHFVNDNTGACELVGGRFGWWLDKPKLLSKNTTEEMWQVTLGTDDGKIVYLMLSGAALFILSQWLPHPKYTISCEKVSVSCVEGLQEYDITTLKVRQKHVK